MFWLLLQFALATMNVAIGSTRIVQSNADKGWGSFSVGILLYIIVYWQYQTYTCSGVI